MPVKKNQPTLLKDLQDAFGAVKEAREAAGGEFTGAEVPAWLQREWQETGVVFDHVLETSCKKRHGRRESREVWTLSDPELNDYVGSAGTVGEPWPGLQQIVQIDRKRTIKRKTTLETTYYIISRPPQRASAAQTEAWMREYWGIENRLHYVRDETFGEDRSQVRSGAAPQVLAACRNLCIDLLRRSRDTFLAEALRSFASRPKQTIDFLLSAHLLQ